MPEAYSCVRRMPLSPGIAFPEIRAAAGQSFLELKVQETDSSALGTKLGADSQAQVLRTPPRPDAEDPLSMKHTAPVLPHHVTVGSAPRY